MSTLIEVRYSGDAPDTNQVMSLLGIVGKQYTYLVATTALERIREHLKPFPELQTADTGPVLVFHKVLRHLLQRRLLSRAEERVMIDRAIAAAVADPELVRLLKRDVFALRDALADLAAQGADFGATIPPPLLAAIADSTVAALLPALHSVFLEQQHLEGRQTFEGAAYAFLRDQYQPTPVVVMEGFSHLTPLQQYYVDQVLRKGATLYLLYPYRDEQAPGFAIYPRTYSPYTPYRAPGGPLILSTPPQSRPANLATLRDGLFPAYGASPGGIMPQAPAGMPIAPDRSVILKEYAHRHQEVAECIRELKQLLPKMRPRDIAIVVRDVAAYQALLLEEADRQELPVSLSLPPRLLLLTPLGRFALTLYEIWRDGALQLTADQFEAILASGWLGAHVQATTDRFNAVKDHMFARCRTREEWLVNLAQLVKVRDQQANDSRLAARSVDDQTARLWRTAIGQIDALCARLFAAGDQAIGGHIRDLLAELDRFAPESMLATEREVLHRIRDALLQVAEESSLEISPAEFGSVLNSLVQEYERPAEEETAIDDDRV